MTMFPPRTPPTMPGGAPGVAPQGAPQGAPNRFALLKKRLMGSQPPSDPDDARAEAAAGPGPQGFR